MAETRLPSIGDLWHKGVLQSRGETGSTTSSKARLFDFVDDPIGPHLNDVLGLMPVTSLERASNKGIFVFIKVRENPILVLKISVHSLWPCHQSFRIVYH